MKGGIHQLFAATAKSLGLVTHELRKFILPQGFGGSQSKPGQAPLVSCMVRLGNAMAGCEGRVTW